MLERNWKQAPELGISEETRDNLIEVLNRMETGQITDDLLDMTTFGTNMPSHCKRCIGGHLRLVALEKVGQSFKAWTSIPGHGCDEHDGNWLHSMFYPQHFLLPSINVNVAREVIDHFLRTSDIDWERAVEKFKPGEVKRNKSMCPSSSNFSAVIMPTHFYSITQEGVVRELAGVN